MWSDGQAMLGALQRRTRTPSSQATEIGAGLQNRAEGRREYHRHANSIFLERMS
jgi:hypothetical protein